MIPEDQSARFQLSIEAATYQLKTDNGTSHSRVGNRRPISCET
jgi:hypothetical protein